jgi:hypothetical protein
MPTRPESGADVLCPAGWTGCTAAVLASVSPANAATVSKQTNSVMLRTTFNLILLGFCVVRDD